MKRSVCWVAAAMLCLAAWQAAAEAPLAAYGKLPSIEEAAVSPDGTLTAVAVTDGEQRYVLILQAKDDTPTVRLRGGVSKVRGLQWAGSNHLLITASVTGEVPGVISPTREWFIVVDYNLKTGGMRNILQNAPDAIAAVEGTPAIRFLNGKPYAFVEATHFVQNDGRLSLFKVDLEGGRDTLVIDGQPNTDDWLVGEDGQPLAESRYDADAGRWTLRVKKGGDWRVVETIDTGYGSDGLQGLGRDGRSVLVSASKDDRDALSEYSPDSTSSSDPFVVEDNVEPIFDPVTERLIGTHALVGDHDDYRFFAASDQAIWDATAKAFAGQRVTLQNLSADHKKLMVLVDSPTEGPAYALVDIATGSARYIGDVYDELKPADVSPVSPVAFKAKDGLAISGYLTLPRGRDPKGLPLVVFPHGGPAARDEPSFDWWAQAMASHGYAVLQVNYRGSDGFGWDFLRAGFGQWGRKMQTDLSDGVRYLAAQGTIDPKRVCIVGASYGGYAALAGPTLDAGVYRCAVDVAGISNPRRFVEWAKNRSDVSTQRYWDRYMGVDGLRDPRLADISPVDHVGAQTPPILLIHGKDDTVVPFEQSQMMVDALQKAGKPAELVVLKHEDHWLSHGDTRLQMLQATIDFLEKNNPPG